MKILFTADWHIKIGQKKIPIDWQINRYRLLFSKIKELQKHCDMIIVGGDIFDKLPSLEELELFFEFLYIVEKPTIIYDGNHEATKKGKSFLSKLEKLTNIINNKITIVTEKTLTIENIDIIPYTELKTFNPNDFSSNILCTHVRGSIPPYVKPEIDLNKLSRWDVVLAGDLHAYSNSQLNILYPGSPLSTSFHRSKINNGLIIFNTITLNHEWIDLKLPQLIRKNISSKEEMIPSGYDHTIYELSGNIKDLSNIDTSNELLDKKILLKAEEAKLSFKNTSLTEEMVQYFEKVLNLKNEEIDNILGVFYDIAENIDLE